MGLSCFFIYLVLGIDEWEAVRMKLTRERLSESEELVRGGLNIRERSFRGKRKSESRTFFKQCRAEFCRRIAVGRGLTPAKRIIAAGTAAATEGMIPESNRQLSVPGGRALPIIDPRLRQRLRAGAYGMADAPARAADHITD